MLQKKHSDLYETFHSQRKLQKRIISDNNFTYRELLKILKPYLTNVTSVLDIGSGVGTIAFYLASKGKKVTGIEISTKAVEIARENATLFGLDKQIEFISAAFPQGVPDKKYDLVIFSEVIEHLKNDKKALKDIWEVLKPGGLLVITTPSQNAPLYRLGLLKNFDTEVGHVRRYTKENLEKIVKEADYDILEFGIHEGIVKNFLFTNHIAGSSLRYIKWNISDLVSFIDGLTIHLFGGSNLHVVAKKKAT